MANRAYSHKTPVLAVVSLPQASSGQTQASAPPPFAYPRFLRACQPSGGPLSPFTREEYNWSIEGNSRLCDRAIQVLTSW